MNENHDSKDEALESLCLAFLTEAGKNREHTAGFSRLVEQLTPTFHEWVQAKIRKMNVHDRIWTMYERSDLFQDFLLRLYKTPPGDQDITKNAISRLRAWVNTVTHHLMVDIYRKIKNYPGRLPPEMELVDPHTEEHDKSVETLASLHIEFPSMEQVLKELSDFMTKQQFLLFQLDLESTNYSAAELAQRLEVTLENLYQIRRRYRKVLCDYLIEKGL